MNNNQYQILLDEAIHFFMEYSRSHTRRIPSFKYAAAITRDISAEVTTVEKDIIDKIVITLQVIKQLNEFSVFNLTNIAEYLNQANEALSEQYKNVHLAYKVAPVPPHKYGLDEANRLLELLKSVRDNHLLKEYAIVNTTTWHTPKHRRGIQFTRLELVPYLLKNQQFDDAKNVLNEITSNKELPYKKISDIAARDDFHAYPPSFLPTFKAIKEIGVNNYTKEKIIHALKIVEEKIPEPSKREEQTALKNVIS